MTPFGTCTSRPSALCLHITEYQCRCGNRWTHSQPLHYGNGHFGGTPTPQEEAQRVVARVVTAQRSYAHCFRCIPVGTPVGFAPAALRRAATAPSLASLEDSIFS